LAGSAPVARWEALIFDFDGVIADTEPLHWQSWVELLAPRGFDLNWDDYCRECRGVSESRMLEALERLTPQAREWGDLPLHYPERKRRVLERVTAAPPIARETVEMLAGLEGYRVGLVTSALEEHVSPVLRSTGIDSCFHALVYANEVRHHKPAPDPYLLAAKKLGVTSGLAFEDSAFGIESALAAGLDVVQVDDPSRLAELVRRSLY
jgi:beta-phosphoglucomutase